MIGYTKKRAGEELPEEFDKRVIAIAEDSPFIQKLGIEIVALDKGYAKGRMKVREEILNPYGTVHGGCLYTLGDTVSGVAASTLGCAVSTINGNMNFLVSVKDTQYIYCEAKMVRHGKKLAVYDISILDDNDQLLDTGTYTFLVYPDVIL